MKSERKSRQISSNEDWREGRTDFRQWKSDGRADRFQAMKNERKIGSISGNGNRTEGKTGFQQSKVKRLDWDGTLQVTPYRPYLGFKSRRPFRQRDRLSNFRDSGLDFTITDGKEAMNGFPAGNSGEEEGADFQQKKTGRIRRNDWMTRRISNSGKELL